MMSEEAAKIVESVIRQRRTEKVLCDVEHRQEVPDAIANQHRQTILNSIEAAGWAPFHFPRKVDGIAEPWRAHVLWENELQQTAVHMRDQLKVTSKEPRLVAGCSVLILVTWLPEFYKTDSRQNSPMDDEAQCMRDEEHLAAASAMVQNLLLLLTAHGMGTYWSSGGRFRRPEMFEFLGIPTEERLLAAVFVEYPEMMDDTKERKSGAQRNNRSDQWIRQVSI